MTQNDFIRKYLNNGGRLSSDTAKSTFGIQNLRARVNELRQDGVFIVTTRHGNTFTYSLARPNKEFISQAYKTAGGALFRRTV